MQISIQELLSRRKSLPVIDVRTQAEYLQGSLLNATSYPIFNEEERAAIGTTYRHAGRLPAMQEAYETLAAKMPGWLEGLLGIYGKARQEIDAPSLSKKGATGVSLRHMEGDEKLPSPPLMGGDQGEGVAILCWRGGMRSESVTYLLRTIGRQAWQVAGGYKAWRNYLLEALSLLPAPPTKLITLYGLTGAGKTLILEELSRRALPVVDLEALANHRGSAFGHIGLGAQPTQQWFESGLYEALAPHSASPFLFVEGESRRIGDLLLPPHFMEAMQGSLKILVSSSLACRAERILHEYAHQRRGDFDGGSRSSADDQLFHDSISAIEKRLGSELASTLHSLLDQEKLQEVAQLLLSHYYDKCYEHTRKSDLHFDLTVSSENIPSAVDEITRWYEKVKNSTI